MRRCLYGWREGSYNFRTKLSKKTVDDLSKLLQTCNYTKPMDFYRAVRTLKYLKFWKGSEYNVFLLYLGPVLLKPFLPTEIYEHFLILSTAVTILSCKSYKSYLDIANCLLNSYLERYVQIYGIDSISSNVHNLCHVVDDVRKFGSLPEISSYPFENYLGQIKMLVRSGNLPLSQVSRRVIEKSHLSLLKEVNVDRVFVDEQNKNDSNSSICINTYNRLHLAKKFILRNDKKNNYFMTVAGDIVSMIHATYSEKKIMILGFSLKNKYDFFLKPFPSSRLNIFASKGILHVNSGRVNYKFDNNAPKLYLLNEIKCKLYCLFYKDEFVFMPLLHTLDLEITM